MSKRLALIYGRKYTFLLVTIIISLFQVGCDNFEIGQNIAGKQIIFDRNKFCFYVQDRTTKSVLIVKYNQKICSVLGVVQNQDKSLTALKVSTHVSKQYKTTETIGNRILPQRYIIIVSGNKIIYALEAPELTSIQWQTEKLLLIISSNRKIVINRQGKVVKSEFFKDNQLKQVPHETVF